MEDKVADKLKVLTQSRAITTEVIDECLRQVDKWGIQNHPSLDCTLRNREGGCTPLRMAQQYEVPSETRARQLLDNAARKGELTWAHILMEEVAEAIGTENIEDLRAELIQAIAVGVSWVASIDRNNQ